MLCLVFCFCLFVCSPLFFQKGQENNKFSLFFRNQEQGMSEAKNNLIFISLFLLLLILFFVFFFLFFFFFFFERDEKEENISTRKSSNSLHSLSFVFSLAIARTKRKELILWSLLFALLCSCFFFRFVFDSSLLFSLFSLLFKKSKAKKTILLSSCHFSVCSFCFVCSLSFFLILAVYLSLHLPVFCSLLSCLVLCLFLVFCGYCCFFIFVRPQNKRARIRMSFSLPACCGHPLTDPHRTTLGAS